MLKSNSQPLLQVDHLSAGYGRAEVLADLTLRVDKGSVVTVIGPNGAGKSTLLCALMGVLPSGGRSQYEGRDISRSSLEDRVRHGIALVPETRALFGTMTVTDNLQLGAYRLRSSILRPRRVESALDEVYGLFPRLAERRRQLAGTLSGGERQMLAIGRALMGKPRLLMLDEPSLGLAPLIVKEIFEIIDHLRRAGVSILLVEQNARAALDIADYAYVLETGAIALHGLARSLADDARVVQTYLGMART